jgi:NtrC-family two-component system sensor histidine kinase KinB
MSFAKARLGLRARFIGIAGLLVATTVASGLWSAVSFGRLGSLIRDTLQDSEATTAATSGFTSALEREDDALLLQLTDAVRGRAALFRARKIVDANLARLTALLITDDERRMADMLTRDVQTYRRTADQLLASVEGNRFERYHHEVNPLLREAVMNAGRVRDGHFAETQYVAVRARDEALRSVLIVSCVSLLALLLSVAVVIHLARVVIWPLRDISETVEVMRQGHFERRTLTRSNDELGRLGDGINRMAEDLAEFQRTNLREVLRAKRTLEATLAALPDAVVVWDADGIISSSNEAARALLGSAGSSGHHLEDIRLPAETLTAVRMALAGEPRSDRDLHPASAIPLELGNHLRKFIPRVVPARSRCSNEQGAVLILNDVTEFVKLEERRIELVAMASHELGTPLTTLRMALMMLNESSATLGPREQDLLGAALFGAKQLAEIVDEFLDLTRIEVGQLRLARDRFRVGDLARAVARSFLPRCEETGVSLHVEDGGAPLVVWGDSTRIRAVLVNLIDNAIKYTPSGGSIVLGAVLQESADASRPSRVEITVADTGPGIREDFRERIFDKFFRVEHVVPQHGRIVRGSGIGLYLARQIVEAHGGTIACGSRGSGKGTVIQFTLPVDGPSVTRLASTVGIASRQRDV